MKKNSWKTLLSVVLLLTMLVSMLPSAAFAEDGPTAATPTEEAAKPDGGDTTLYAQWADDPKWSELGIDISAPQKAFPEADITYGITVTNGTGYDLNSVTVDVTLPVEVTYDESLSSSGAWSLSYNSATRVLTAKLESADGSPILAANGTSEFNLPVKIKKMAFETIEAKAKITGASSPTGGKTGESSSAAAQTTMAATEIHVITEQAEQLLGKEITYIVEITNQYGFAMNSIEVNNVMSSSDCISGLQLSSDSLKNGWSLVSNSNGSLLCKFTGKLYSGATTSFKLTTKFDKVGSTPDSKTAACTATITSLTDENGTVSGNFGSKSATVTLKELDWSKLKIEKKVDKTTAGLGNTLKYEIKVTNNTGYDLSYLCVEDPTPANTSYPTGSQDSGNWFLSIPSDNSKVVAELRGGLANGASGTFTMEVGVDRDVPSGKVESTATITSAKSGSYYDLTKDHPDGLPSNTVTTEIDPMFNLDIEVRALQPAAGVGEDHKFTYEVTVRNNGVWLSTAKIENVFPEGVGTIVGTPDQNCGFSSDYSTVDIYSIPKDESVSYTITTNFVPGGAVTAVLEAKIVSVTTQAENTYTGSKSAKAAVYSLAGLTIEKAVDKPAAKPGDTLTYTITVKNGTGTTLKDVLVADQLPIDKVDVDPKGLPSASDYDVVTGIVNVTIDSLAAGGEYSFVIEKVTVNAGVTDAVKNIAWIHALTLDNGKEVYGDALAGKTAEATTDILTENIPVNVTVEFKGLEDVSEVPAGYKLTGDAANAFDFFTGEVALGNAVNKGGHISRSFSTTADVVLGKEYALNFTQTGYNVPGYTAVLTSETAPIKDTAADEIEGLSFQITITYTKTLAAYKALTVRTYFEGVTALPENFGYTLTCINSPTEAQKVGFDGPVKLVSKGLDPNGVPYMEYTVSDIQLPVGKELTFKFTQNNYNIDGYNCKPGTSEFTRTLSVPATDVGEEVVMEIRNVYTPKTQEMDATVTVKFIGLDKDTKLPAGYTLTGDKANEFLTGAITLTKDESADTAVYSGKVTAVPGKAYKLGFTQGGLDIDGYVCKTDAAVSTTVTADKEKGIAVNLTVSYTKLDWSKLTVTKTADKTYALSGAYVKYTITVTNNMGVDLTNVNVLDHLPANVRYSSSSGGYDRGTSSWTIAELADGASRTLTIRVKLNSGLTNDTVIENTAYITGVTIDGQEYVFENLWLNDSAKVTVTDGKGSPKTGDESNLGLWIAVMAASLACAGTAAVIYKKRRS